MKSKIQILASALALAVLSLAHGQGYLMQITVSGAPSISSVEVVLNGFKHDRPDDVDILLVPPSPAPPIMLMSDAGGSTAVQNLTLTFSQSGFLLPNDEQLFTGIFARQTMVKRKRPFQPGIQIRHRDRIPRI